MGRFCIFEFATFNWNLSPLQGLLWSGEWVGFGPCDSFMGWLGLCDIKWAHVHLWAGMQKIVLDCANGYVESTLHTHTHTHTHTQYWLSLIVVACCGTSTSPAPTVATTARSLPISYLTVAKVGRRADALTTLIINCQFDIGDRIQVLRLTLWRHGTLSRCCSEPTLFSLYLNRRLPIVVAIPKYIVSSQQ